MTTSPRRPTFFIVGAPKSGTTSMMTYLRQHPQIFMPAGWVEPHYFGSDLESHAFIRDLEVYIDLFSDARDEAQVGEKSPWYLYSTRAAQEIHRFAPNARIIAMLRNPLELIHSLHTHNLYRGNEDIPDLEAAIGAQADREMGLRLPIGAHLPEMVLYTRVPRFRAQVERYLRRFGPDRVKVIIFKDFAANTAEVFRATLEHLGVDSDFAPALDRMNASKRARSDRLRNFTRRPPAALKRVVKAVLPPPARRWLLESLVRLNTKRIERKPMDESVRRRLAREFRDEVLRLGELLDQDLTHWITPD